MRDVEAERERERARRQRARAAGLCSWCLARPPRPGFKTCSPCRERAAARQKPSRAQGCAHCGSFEHYTKTHGRAPYTGPSRRPFVRIGPIVRKRLGIVPVVPVVSSWLVNPT